MPAPSRRGGVRGGPSEGGAPLVPYQERNNVGSWCTQVARGKGAGRSRPLIFLRFADNQSEPDKSG